MKRNDSLPFLFIVPLVIGASFAAGYFFFGGHQAPPPAPAPIPMPAPVDTAPKPAPIRRRQVASAGEYIAPGSPKITINEVKGAPPIKRTPPVVDSESSETGVTPPPAPPVITSEPAPPSPDAAPATPAPSDATEAGGTAPDATTAGTPPPAPDPSPATPVGPATGTDAPDPNAPLYRVNAGTFQDEKNAKNFADALRRRGYTAIAQPSGDPGSTSYRVQVGVYHNRATADQAATDLQRSGYPAFVSAK